MKSDNKYLFVILVIPILLFFATGFSVPYSNDLKSIEYSDSGSTSDSYAISFRGLNLAIRPLVETAFNFLQVETPGDKLVFGSSYVLEEGEELTGNLVVFGGNVVVEQNARVNGDVVVMGGSADINGTVTGDMVTFGGFIEIGENAVINGDAVAFGGSMDKHDAAQIQGDTFTGTFGPMHFSIPEDFDLTGINAPQFRLGFNPFWSVLWFFLKSFIWALVAVLVALFLPKPTKRIAATVVSEPILSGGVGLLTALVSPLVVILLVITLIGIPISFLLVLALIMAWVFGMIAIGTEVGVRISHAFQKEWALGLSAGIGTFILSLVVNAAGEAIPCIGWILPVVIGLIGLGAVLLTRAGSRNYPPDTEQVAVPKSSNQIAAKSSDPEIVESQSEIEE